MPTPTIDPMVYEAAYAAIRHSKIDKLNAELIVLAIIGVIWFFIWLFKE